MRKYVTIYRISFYMKPEVFTSSRSELCPITTAEEECRTCENYSARTDSEVLEVFAVFAEHRYDEKQLKQDHSGTMVRDMDGVARCRFTAML